MCEYKVEISVIILHYPKYTSKHNKFLPNNITINIFKISIPIFNYN